ncbi:serine phosphatase RsbU (regulator of sigma subunit)/anti-sigma regulatory factor (Ser/Thr protein kinase) [Kitasatospora gansuensis]|uniref:Serine phosphatase RsbU (Regulator of sigma subunit)/anti-sigma regulatory factor (Ser/Thr protein kinase) n=1 Tax=Kitasatospora gansuensis TaxID=258050 RepID=A0A7W7WGV4_9ACTN|nr:SpoIIE family protein phosphatase [Kitasatospora gansuensis]MBB4946591.1 serine phosphatase RsbU (regulator of sigma subunit)/anti-sigma regulatory factor (Ser/Thr protein kinase) [Kitasatospora gansuensis]
MVTARAAATFEPVDRSAAAARGFVRDALLGWGLPEVVDDAVVLVSELVTNAVVHAGTAAEVCVLREEETIRIEVTDRHPERGLPSFANVPAQSSERYGDPDGEGGRGLLMCSAISSCWGVEYSAGQKTVWFRLALPEHIIGTRYALPALPGGELPGAEGPVLVAVVQVDEQGLVSSWNQDAEALLRLPAEQAVGRPWSTHVLWPPDGPELAETLRLARWEGGFSLRLDGQPEVYAVQVRVRDTHGVPSTLCLLVHESDRAVLRSPATGSDAPAGVEPFDLLVGHIGPDDLGGLLQRIVERARDLLDSDAAYLLLTTDDETEFELRAATGLPGAGRRHPPIPVDSGAGRYDSARLPAVHEDLAIRPNVAPLLAGSGLRSLITVPLKVDGRLTGSLGVAAFGPGRYDNEDALRLQFAADRVALALESARLTELERLRRGSLSFLVEASDLLAGTLEHGQTLALMAQMAVPTLASWCAVYTTHDAGADLAFVLHQDEDRIDQLRALLDKTPPPEAGPDNGVRFWTAPVEAARLAGLTDSPELAGLLGEIVVLPLAARNRVIGLLVLGVSTGLRFRQEMLELAEDLSRRAALALDNSRLYSERTATSQAFQRALLPPELPKIPGVEVEVFYQAAGEGNEVGGDFYDIFPIREGTYGFAIGDVCGTGPEAAAVTGLARHALRLLAREGLDGPQLLGRLNTAILDEGSRSRFLTLLYGELTPRPDGSTDLSLVCAGHPLPLRLTTDGRVDAAATPQPLLGVLDELELVAEQFTLHPGEVLLCVTDGVTERREGQRMLGDDGLAAVLSGCTGLTAGAVAARVQRAVERFAAEPPSDDMAILTLRIPEQRKG